MMVQNSVESESDMRKAVKEDELWCSFNEFITSRPSRCPEKQYLLRQVTINHFAQQGGFYGLEMLLVVSNTALKSPPSSPVYGITTRT